MHLTRSTAPIGTIPAHPPMALRGKSRPPTLHARVSSARNSISSAWTSGLHRELSIRARKLCTVLNESFHHQFARLFVGGFLLTALLQAGLTPSCTPDP